LNLSTLATRFCEPKAESVTAWYRRKTVRIAEKGMNAWLQARKRHASCEKAPGSFLYSLALVEAHKIAAMILF
jgi:hypothetical protein